MLVAAMTTAEQHSKQDKVILEAEFRSLMKKVAQNRDRRHSRSCSTISRPG